MKKILTVALIAICISAKAQITLEHTFKNQFEKVTFTSTSLGEKYVSSTTAFNTGGTATSQDTLTIYNADYSVYKTIVVPAGWSYYDPYTFAFTSVPSVSDQLFNTDTLIEYMTVKHFNAGCGGYGYLYRVYNELGQVVFTTPDTIDYYNNGINIFKIGNSFKLAATVDLSGCVLAREVFSLPGSLPCSQCNSFVSGIEEPSGAGSAFGLAASPNPFNNTLNISYNMSSQQDAKISLTDMIGRELATYPISKQSDNFSINTSDLPRGMIILSLLANNGQLISKKLVKIH